MNNKSLKGFRTIALSIVLAVWGVVEAADAPSDKDGWVKLAFAIGFAILRVITTTPIGESEERPLPPLVAPKTIPWPSGVSNSLDLDGDGR